MPSRNKEVWLQVQAERQWASNKNKNESSDGRATAASLALLRR